MTSDQMAGRDGAPCPISTGGVRQISEAFDLGTITVLQYLPAGLMNQNWRCDSERGSFALKRLTDASGGDAESNLAVMRELAGRGLPVCDPLTSRDGDLVVTVEGAAYCAVPWVDGQQPHGLDLGLDQVAALGSTLADLHVGLDQIGAPLLPYAQRRPTARVADPATAARDADRFLATAEANPEKIPFDGEVAEFVEQRKALLDRAAGLRPMSDQPSGPFGWTHGDFQHLNVLWSGDTVAAVIDWDRIRVRMRGEELARSATLLFGRNDGLLDLARVASFIAGYRRVVEISNDALSDAVDRLLWKRVCDFWHLEFHYDRGDHSCDHLFASSCRLVGWWTEHRDEVRDAFTDGG